MNCEINIEGELNDKSMKSLEATSKCCHIDILCEDEWHIVLKAWHNAGGNWERTEILESQLNISQAEMLVSFLQLSIKRIKDVEKSKGYGDQ